MRTKTIEESMMKTLGFPLLVDNQGIIRKFSIATFLGSDGEHRSFVDFLSVTEGFTQFVELEVFSDKHEKVVLRALREDETGTLLEAAIKIAKKMCENCWEGKQ